MVLANIASYFGDTFLLGTVTTRTTSGELIYSTLMTAISKKSSPTKKDRGAMGSRCKRIEGQPCFPSTRTAASNQEFATLSLGQGGAAFDPGGQPPGFG